MLNNVTTKFIGSHYEIDGTTIIKYYLAGATRVAMRTGTSAPVYFLPDHLGSTSITTDSSGNLVSELLYKAWGEVRYSSGTTPTDYTYTNQYSNMADFGLMYYNARWYDPALGRFVQADTLIPSSTQGTQAWDRYTYVNNNPVRYTDPSGHCFVVDLCLVDILVLATVAVVATAAVEITIAQMAKNKGKEIFNQRTLPYPKINNADVAQALGALAEKYPGLGIILLGIIVILADDLATGDPSLINKAFPTPGSQTSTPSPTNTPTPTPTSTSSPTQTQSPTVTSTATSIPSPMLPVTPFSSPSRVLMK